MIAKSSTAAVAPSPRHGEQTTANVPMSHPASRAQHDRMANAIRALAMDAVEQAKSGHPGLPMGAADIATVLFTQFVKLDPADPAWPDRDRFVLSAGHGSMLIYAVLHLLGFESVSMDEIRRFRQIGSRTPGHPENFVTPGVETTTGPLGQGLANAVGMAIAERHLAAEFGPEVVDHWTYVLASDGDLMEGLSQEAIALAGHLKLSRLVVLFDDNGISIDGPLSLADSVDQVKRFEAAGWAATRIDGHDPQAIADAIERAKTSDRPSMIACRTIIGYGAPSKAGSEKAHGSPLGEAEIKGAREKLGWSEAPFHVPADVLTQWRAAGQRSKSARKDWDKRLAALPADSPRRLRAPHALRSARHAQRRGARGEGKARQGAEGNRHAGGLRTGAGDLIPAVPEMVGGSADLTGSNNTRTKSMKAITPQDFSGRFIHYGVREHAMAAAMNGMALHRGIIPYSGTFLVFSRLLPAGAAARGADGRARDPRHDPRLDRARRGRADPPAGRAPGGAARHSQPQRVPAVRRGGDGRMLAAGAGGEGDAERAGADPSERAAAPSGPHRGQPLRRRRLRDRAGRRRREVSLFATGSEVAIAVEARKVLRDKDVPSGARGVGAVLRAVSRRTRRGAGRAVIGDAPVKIAVEAAVRPAGTRIIGSDGLFVGMDGFGASAPYKELYRHFGITAETVAEAALTSGQERSPDQPMSFLREACRPAASFLRERRRGCAPSRA